MISERRQETSTGAEVAQLFEEHGRMVYGLCRMLLRNREEAEDAAQQTFLSAHRTLLRGGRYETPGAWLGTIARNECRRRLGKRRLEVVPLNGFEAGAAGADASLDEREELDALYRALTELPRAQRQAIVLHEFYGLSYSEVATALGRSGRAVESLLFKSRRKLELQLRPLRDAAGAFVVPLTLRDSLGSLIAGFSGPSAAAVGGAGGVAAAKMVGLPTAGKLVALLIAGLTATGVAAERVDRAPVGERAALPHQAARPTSLPTHVSRTQATPRTKPAVLVGSGVLALAGRNPRPKAVVTDNPSGNTPGPADAVADAPAAAGDALADPSAAASAERSSISTDASDEHKSSVAPPSTTPAPAPQSVTIAETTATGEQSEYSQPVDSSSSYREGGDSTEQEDPSRESSFTSTTVSTP